MSDAATAPLPTTSPSRVGRLLDLVRKLIDYGRELAATLRQPDAAADLTPTTRAFGTGDIALILARITRGLHMAGALEQRLVRNGRRMDAPRKPPSTPDPAKPAAAPRVRPAPQPAPPLDHLPQPEQIAAAIRRRPIGGVIADICRDLGILPSHPLWREVHHLITLHGGSFVRLAKDTFDRVFPLPNLRRAPAAAVPKPPPVGTGPP